MNLARALAGALRVNPLENPGRPLTDESLSELLGGIPTASGVHVNEHNATRIIAVYRAVQLIAGTIATLPIRVRRDGSEAPITAGPLVQLLRRPAPGFTSFEWRLLLWSHLLLWGNAYALKGRGTVSGDVRALKPILPQNVSRIEEVDPHPTRNPDGRLYTVQTVTGGTKVLTSADVLHLRGLSLDGVWGLSPIGQARQALGLSLAAEESAARLYSNGVIPSGILSSDQVLDKKSATSAKERFRAAVAGLEHHHDVAVLGAGLTYQALTMNPSDAQFLESRQWGVVEIARLYGLPPHLLGEVSKSTSWGSGIEAQGVDMVRYTLQPWLSGGQERLTADLCPDGEYVEFDTAGLMRADLLKRYQAYALAAGPGGWMLRDEVRTLEGRPELGGEMAEPIPPANAAPDPAAGSPPDDDAPPPQEDPHADA